MKIYYIENLKSNFFHAYSKARNDSEYIFKKFEMKPIKNIHIQKNNIIFKLIIQGINILLNLDFLFSKEKIIFCQFPVEQKWINIYFYKLKNIKIVSLIHDIDGLRYQDEKKLKKELELLKNSRYIISHNDKMSNFLINNGIDRNKLINLNVFDYLIEEKYLKTNKIKKMEICYAGNLAKSQFIYKLNKIKNIDFNIYGINYEKEKNINTFNYCGFFSPNEICEKLYGKYGLVWDGESLNEINVFGDYIKYINPHKLSLYIASGLPVIVWKKSAVSDFVERNNLGIVIDSLYELEKTLFTISDEEYNEKLKNVIKIREKIINGKMLSKIIVEIIKKEKNE